MIKSEPGITSSLIGGGISLAALGTAGYDALIENGWQPKTAMFVVLIAGVIINVGAAIWARRSTVTMATYNAGTAVALALPASSDMTDLNKALVTQPEPLPAVEPAPVIESTAPRTFQR